MMAMTFDLKKAFRKAAAVVLMGLAGAGVSGYGYHATHGMLDAHHSPESVKAVEKYETRLTGISELQTSLAATSDEDAATRLEKKKKTFIADVVLDTALSEADVGTLAANFNKLSADDAVVFRFATDNPSSVRERNECLNDVLLTPDRNETAERTQDCMLAYAQKDKDATETATEVGALVGMALAGSFLLGGLYQRRKSGPPQAS
jgi:hypothetical protein